MCLFTVSHFCVFADQWWSNRHLSVFFLFFDPPSVQLPLFLLTPSGTEIAGQENKEEYFLSFSRGYLYFSPGYCLQSTLWLAPYNFPCVTSQGYPTDPTSWNSPLYNPLPHSSRAGIEQKRNDYLSILRLCYKIHGSFHLSLSIFIITCSKKNQLPCCKNKKIPQRNQHTEELDSLLTAVCARLNSDPTDQSSLQILFCLLSSQQSPGGQKKKYSDYSCIVPISVSPSTLKIVLVGTSYMSTWIKAFLTNFTKSHK